MIQTPSLAPLQVQEDQISNLQSNTFCYKFNGLICRRYYLGSIKFWIRPWVTFSQTWLTACGTLLLPRQRKIVWAQPLNVTFLNVFQQLLLLLFVANQGAYFQLLRVVLFNIKGAFEDDDACHKKFVYLWEALFYVHSISFFHIWPSIWFHKKSKHIFFLQASPVLINMVSLTIMATKSILVISIGIKYGAATLRPCFLVRIEICPPSC